MTGPQYTGPQHGGPFAGGPQGYQQQPGWQYPPQASWTPQPPQPPRAPQRKSIGLIVSLILVAVLLLGAVAGGVVFYLNVHSDGGIPPTGAQLDPACDAVSEQTRQRLRTTNPDPGTSSARESQGVSLVHCGWTQTLGQDGEGNRDLQVQILRYSGVAAADQRRPRCDGTQLPPPQLGQEACIGSTQSGNITTVTLQVRQGSYFVLVGYSGWDVGFLSNKPAPVQDFANAVAGVGEEVLATLRG